MLKKGFALFCAAVMFLTFSGCKKDEATDNASVTSSAATDTPPATNLKLKEIPQQLTTLKPTFEWTGMAEGEKVCVVLENLNGTKLVERNNITKSSYTVPIQLQESAEYTLKLYYVVDGVKSIFPGMTESGIKITCVLPDGKWLEEIANKIKSSTNYTIVIVGDSITEGYGTSSDEMTYVAQFTRLLAEQLENKKIVRIDGLEQGWQKPLKGYAQPVIVQEGTSGTVTVIRCGVGANNINYVYDRRTDFLGEQPNGDYADLVMFMLGVNDSNHYGGGDTAMTMYKTGYQKVFDAVKQSLPDAKMIVMTPTYADDSNNEEKCKQCAFADAAKELARDAGVPVIDIHKIWMDHFVVGGMNYGQGDWFDFDMYHPSDKGAGAIAQEMIRALFG